MEIDLKKSLVSQFLLDSKVQRVEYENLSDICFHYGKYGHNKEGCPEMDDNGPFDDDLPIPFDPAEKRSMSTAGKDNRNEPKFGPWMVVARKGKPKVEKESTHNQESERVSRGKYGKESRFNVLFNLEDEDSNQEENQEANMERTNRDLRTFNPSPTLSLQTRPIRKKKAYQPANSKGSEHVGTSTRLQESGPNEANKNFQSPPHTRDLRGCTNLHASHANLNLLPTPMHVPTSLNPLHHSAISFPPNNVTTTLHTGDVHPKSSNDHNSAGGHFTLSEWDGDPSTSKALAANMDMEDDANDSDYVATSEDGVDSSDGDVSLVEETTMDLAEEASRLVQ